jgi:hypothetical protein
MQSKTWNQKMQGADSDGGPKDARSEREKALEDKLGGRTILLVFVSLFAVLEGMVLVHLALK